jgi:uncharacterized membrane protein YkoI
MKPTKLVLISIFISAVVLVVIGGVTSNVLASRATTAAPSQDQVKAYQDREAAYVQLIQQANDQLAKANAQLQSLQTQVVQLQAQPTTPTTPDPYVTAEKASQIASNAAGPGEQPQQSPALVEFQGKTAYEVSFAKGLIYVDAQTGDVLYNGTVPQQITADKAGQIVADYLGNSAILKIDQVTIKNVPLFRVIFKNGTLAWVDLTGQITDVQMPAVVVHQDLGGRSSSVTAPSNNPQPPAPSNPPAYHEDDHETESD